MNPPLMHAKHVESGRQLLREALANPLRMAYFIGWSASTRINSNARDAGDNDAIPMTKVHFSLISVIDSGTRPF